VKLPPFEYLAAASLTEAVDALAADDDAKVIAGGQSLMPLLALRLARPSLLVDITRLGLDDVAVEPPAPGSPWSGGYLRLGGTVRQRRLEVDSVVAAAVPLLADAVGHVGYVATRNRGTLGGSLAHSDPVAELPAVAVALGGTVVATGPGGWREIACRDLSDGFFTTTLAPDEILTEIRLPRASARHGAAWCEWAPRAHDFADAGVGVALDLDQSGTVIAVHAAACGIGGRPLLLADVIGAAGVLGSAAEKTRGDCGSPADANHPEFVRAVLLRAVAAAVEAACGSAGDDDKGELAGLLAARAVRLALGRAAGQTEVAA
jgi:carbon-monoxide dehydrogenase medium subunit